MNPDVDLEFRPLTNHVDAALAQERLVAGLSKRVRRAALLLEARRYGVTV